SSRRRHTRFSRDWSSDVCSSDLCFRLERYRPTEPVEPSPVEKARMVNEAGLKVGVVRFADARDIDRYIEETQAAGAGILALTLRSEERRVGQEWTWRWSAHQQA